MIKLDYKVIRERLKKYSWKNPNKMDASECPNKTFGDNLVCLSTGNVIGGGQYSSFIRGWNDIVNPVGQTVEPGHLFNFDIKHFNIPSRIREYIKNLNESVILYEFYHYRGKDKILHGWVLTDTNYKYINLFENPYVGARARSWEVLNWIRPYISWKGEDYEQA